MDNNMCCPEFDPSVWDEKEHFWNEKPFLKDSVFQIMHIPMNTSSVIKRMFDKVQKENAAPDNKDFLILFYDPSSWKSEVYMTVTKEIPNGENVKITGNFISKVFDGAYNEVPLWIKQMDEFLSKRNQKAIKYYFHYAYCPKCSKKYGHNYCIAFAQV